MHALFEGEDPSEKKPLLTERKQTVKTLESELQNWIKKKEAQKHQEPKK